MCGHAITGASGEEDQRGAIYVFDRDESSTWRWTQTLLPSDFAADWSREEDTREFGNSIALDGETLIVGSPFHHRQHGAAYVLELDPAGRWLPPGQLVPDHEWELTRGFGESVALSGDTALVGSFHDDFGQGAAYVFDRGDDGLWRQVQRIASHHYAPIDEYGSPSLTRFGNSAALDGDVAVIGSELANRRQGAATLYARKAGRAFRRIMELQTGQPTDGYGCAVAVKDDTVMVGAWQDSDSGGAVYQFTRRSDWVWVPAQRIAPLRGQRFDNFGRSMALDDDLLAVGASNLGGRAYVFRRDGGQWHQAIELTVPERGPRPIYGRAVALSGDTLLVGDIGDTSRCPTGEDCHTGAAHAYEIGGADAGEPIDPVYQQKLMFAARSYGNVVVADDDLAIVGDPGAVDACPEATLCASGAVHILEPGAGVWVESQRISPADRSRLDHFGHAVARDGDWLAVSAVGSLMCSEDEPCSSSAVYLYHRGSSGAWSEAQRIPSPRSEPGFGTGLALRGDLLLVGRSELERPDDSASAHIYRLEPDETGAFGFASSLRGRTAVVGAPGHSLEPTIRPGRVSIYRLQDPRVYLPALHTVRRRF